jgi:hypothetical protein
MDFLKYVAISNFAKEKLSHQAHKTESLSMPERTRKRLQITM